jgi:folate-binding protein YgfZ
MQFISYPHSVFKISGPDRVRYLQGRVTQDIRNIRDNNALWSLILSPQGKIEGVFYILCQEDCCILVSDNSDSSWREKFLSSLLRFKVADQVFAEDVSDSYRVMSVFSKEPLEESLVEKLSSHGEYSALLRRGSLFCLDIMFTGEVPAGFPQDESGITEVSSDDFDRIRLEAGFPLAGRDIPESIFAPDLPLSRYVSFNKGCYAGQEVVEMATARGRPNRTLVHVRGEGSFAAGSELLLFVKNDDEMKKAGFVTSIASDLALTEFTALGYLKTVFMEEGNQSFFLGESADSVTEVSVSVVQ